MSYFKPKMKILVVDDLPTMRKIVKTLLEQLGFSNFVDAENGARGIEMLNSHPDIAFIISDWNMPHMTGLEFLREVRTDFRFKNIPFMMITAEAEKENVVAAAQYGVQHYIVKPFTVQILKEALVKVDGKINKKAG